MSALNPHTDYFNVSMRVLFYKEEDSWVAHALEMDLLGYGRSAHLAFKDLQKVIQLQLSFAVKKGHPESVFFPAPAEVVKRWEKAQLLSLKQAASGKLESASKMGIQAAVVSFSREQFQEMKKVSKRTPQRANGEQWERLLAAA